MLRHPAILGFVVVVFMCLPVDAAGAGGVGIKGGLTRSSVISSTEWSSGSGFQIGAFGTFLDLTGVEVQPELHFTRRMTDRRLRDGISEIESRVAVDFMEIPVLLRRSVRPVRRATPVFFGGLYSAVVLRARSQSQIGEDAVSEDMKDQFRRWDYGIVAGAGLEFARGGMTWLGEVRYNHGLARTNSDANAERWNTRALAVMAGVRW